MTAPATDAGTAATGFDWKVYPNPTSDIAFVELRLPESSFVTVEVYNNTGIREKLLFSNQVMPNQLYKLTLTGNLPSGMHYLVMRVNNKLYTKKLVVIK